MTYGVVICPRCEQVKAADLNFKTTKCLGCAKVIKLHKTKVLARTDDNEEITFLVGQVKAKLQGEEIEYPAPKKGSKRKKRSVRIGSKRQKQIIDVVINLTNEKGTFQFADFKKAVSKGLGTGKKEDVERFLAFLQARGIIIEPKPGTYRAIEDGL
jgi:hypothetical protein